MASNPKKASMARYGRFALIYIRGLTKSHWVINSHGNSQDQPASSLFSNHRDRPNGEDSCGDGQARWLFFRCI
jgi:hypothetical protein